MSHEPAEVEKLAAELFASVEGDQGFFFVSDAEVFPTTEQFFKRIRGRLQYGERAVRKMRAFLKKYDALDGPARKSTRGAT